MKLTFIPIRSLGTVTEGLFKRLEDLETSGDYPIYYTIDIGQNTEKSPENLRSCCHSDSSERLSANVGVKNSQE